MLKRVRAKEVKRKNENDAEEQGPTKVRCEREERIAVVQLKAYWDCFPFLANDAQPGRTQDIESSEEELIEDDGQERRSYSKPGSSDDHNQELIEHKVEAEQKLTRRIPIDVSTLQNSETASRLKVKQLGKKGESLTQ